MISPEQAGREKWIRPIPGRKRTEKAGKKYSLFGKKLVHIKQAGRKQKRMIIHQATKKITLPLCQGD